jgi:Mg2+-importing ATPase
VKNTAATVSARPDLPELPEQPWARSADDLATALGTDITAPGLTATEATRRLPATRARAVASTGADSTWRLLAKQFTSPIIIILIVATLIAGILGDWLDTVIILVIVVLSGLLDFAQERGAQASMDRLLGSVRLTATVVRDGSETEVPFPEVVAGDVIRVSGGDILPADAVLLDARDLQLDQSSLTGETFPVDKRPGPVAADTELAHRSCLLFSGTHVASGDGTAVVVATGRDTEFGRVKQSLAAKQKPTGFERGMTRFGLMLTRIMVVLVVAIFIVNLVLDRPVVDSALFSLSLAVGLTPQLLPAIVGLSLAQGSKVIAKHRVIVKRLNAIEDFGAMTALCTDKTGTMTAGEIHLSAPLDLRGDKDPSLLRTAGLNALLQSGKTNAMDQAVGRAVHGAGLDLSGATALDELPYDFTRKRLSVLVRDQETGGGVPTLVTKGAVEKVLEVCTHARIDGEVVDLSQAVDDVREVVDDLGARGFRVLAVAATPQDAATTIAAEADLTLVGLLSFADPVKPDAAGTIADFATAGVTVRMITGDARPVATHIAGQLGLDPAAVMSGGQIDALSDEDLAARAEGIRVFCETTPNHKERIVRALGHDGETVGYMGDGINDAPALHAADVGISVTGASDVAAESASIVMLEKDLRALLDGMHAGRRTFANTMKYIQMTTSANVGNMISMAVASVILPFLPLLASQILVINLLTDLPATAIATDRVDPRRLRHPQRWDMRLIRNYMLVFGILSSVFDLVTFGVLRWGFHAGESEFQTAWFLASVLTEVLVLFSLRTRGPLWRSKPSQILVLLSALVAVAAFGIVLSPVGDLLHLEVIRWSLVGLVVLIAVAYVAVTELAKPLFWRAPVHRTEHLRWPVSRHLVAPGTGQNGSSTSSHATSGPTATTTPE